jgi:hypothetical protein
MIARKAKREVDERLEERIPKPKATAMLEHRGQCHCVQVVNLSPSGAMLAFDAVPYIGEQVGVQLVDRDRQRATVRWVRDGRIGVSFDQMIA